MVEICNICGLPKDICVCQKISTEQRKLNIFEKHVRGPIFVTVVTGVEDAKELDDLAKELKKRLACGGTLKNNEIVLQGKHKKKILKYLLEKGYDESQIS